ncbi:MAG TPA: CAP domain-containing protein [Ktedonobacterales bacterium]|nr:CAP domain-containing protein [Ktedonobacterales bacterium]
MSKVQSVWRFLGRIWRIIRQRRSLAWAAGISVVLVIASCAFGVRALNTSASLPQLSYQSYAGAVLLTPTPTPTPKPPDSNHSCPPIAGHEDTAMEAWQINAVNKARASAGVAALKIDSRIHSEALQHSADMTCYGFGHFVPPGTTPATRMAAAGVSFTWHGENIGMAGEGTDLQKVMWLFNSMMAEKPPNDGHRQNILSPNFTRTGIGIYVENASGRLWLTEDFAG